VQLIFREILRRRNQFNLSAVDEPKRKRRPEVDRRCGVS
jgi:hypothetical protein